MVLNQLAPKIRAATAQDSDGLGLIHVQAWQETYAGQMPASYLANLNPAKRAAVWLKVMADSTDRDGLYIAEVNGKTIGFISFGSGRDQSLEGAGEIFAIYLLKQWHGMKIGAALFNTALDQLHNLGFHKVGFWVLDTNQRAMDFYRKAGAVDTHETRTIQIADTQLIERLLTI